MYKYGGMHPYTSVSFVQWKIKHMLAMAFKLILVFLALLAFSYSTNAAVARSNGPAENEGNKSSFSKW